jgi:hypothetical protein
VVSPKGEPTNIFEPAIGSPADIAVTLEGRGSPYLLDAWSGKITPIADYESSAGRVTLRVRLSRDNAELIALNEAPQWIGVAPPKVHVTATSADEAISDRGAVFIRAAKAGTFFTTLSNGRKVRSKLAGVFALIDLTSAKWELRAEDWQPANPYSNTFGIAAVETRKSPVTVDLDGLKPWPAIPALEQASGNATYLTSFELPADWSRNDSATLSLGEVFDSFTLTINGTPVPIDQLSAKTEVGQYLMAGRNTIAVRVATTLNNRLAKIDDSVAKRGIVQPYGLVGPVTLSPNKLVQVSALAAASIKLKSKQPHPQVRPR